MHREPKLIGNSLPIQKLRHFIKKAAKSDATVLLLGETGVGKEVAARMIHLQSHRCKNPFVKINCANLSDTMIESELFGHKKGAFTDAVIDKPGLMEEADGGTFFCDEIADISPNLQAKFLSVLEDRELRRLGENRTREIDVRFILATNRNLYKLVEKGKFRKDLFYRISVLSFQISPLRERKGDIPLLIDFLIERESKRKSEDFMLSQEAFGKLLRHSFPGNVRELENILEGAIVFTDNSVIEEKDILFTKVTCETEVKYRSRYSFDKILDTMVKHQGNKTKAAQELGISRMHFYRLLDELRK